MKILGANPLKGDASAFPALRGMPAFPRKQFAAAGYVNNHSGGELITEVLTSANNGVWIAPSTTNIIKLIEGYGSLGTPVRIVRTWERYWEDYYYYVDGSFDSVTGGPDRTGTGNPPTGVYCDAPTPQTGRYTEKQRCYSYTTSERVIEATYGTSVFLFDLEFKGGYGEQVRGEYSTSYSNIIIIPNMEYILSIPSGGQLTMTYTK
jgi:hypothetical protein